MSDTTGRKIRVLDTATVNQIAAGEVVERPASVVKELVENAIDAGARSVRIDITSVQGGIAVIRVTDDGCGMSPADAELAFVPHATSKIATIDDIFSVRTLGFRGEALASIAAVAQVELKTRQKGEEAGTLVRIEGGTEKEVAESALKVGTIITVKNLFYNTPARRQFLKSTNTEFRHIYDVVQRAAISHPEIAFVFLSDEDELLDLKPATREDRLKDLYGERQFETLVPVEESTDLVSLSGFLGKPDFARKSKPDQYLFLNGRFIVSRSINHAVFSGYEHLMEKGNFPFYALFLAIDPHRVDVNVHPSKMEVKFSDEQSIYRFVMAVVRRAIGSGDSAPGLSVSTMESDPVRASLRHLNAPRYLEREGPAGAEGAGVPLPAAGWNRSVSALPELDALFGENPARSSGQPERAPLQFQHGQRESEAADGKAIWQLHNKYILSQIRSGLMIIDQHVAHERILYEKALHSYHNAVPASQQLLFPQTLQFAAGDYALVKELMPHLLALGFELKLFGKNTIVLEGVPTDVRPGSESTILQDILAEYRNNQHRVKLEERDNLAKSFACKAAVKAGDKLNETEMRSLIDQLFATSMPYVCPHGRPIVVKISLGELDRRFMRTS